MKLPWLDAALESFRRARASGRLPHAVLIQGSAGVGAQVLAQQLAQLCLCRGPSPQPCGQCLACRQVAAHQHPDCHEVIPTEDSKQIRIEQIRELAGELALTSHRPGYKIGLLWPADALNRNAANALLKTLEEPPPRTLLVLVAAVPSRLPATLLSRCQRVRIAAPERAQSLAWLNAQRPHADWARALEVLGDAPLAALASDPAAIVKLHAETLAGLADALRGAADPPSLAERWSRGDLALHLRSIETWLTDRIRERSGVQPDPPELRAGAHLSEARSDLNIHKLFELLDAVRELASLLDTPLNRALATEELIWRFAGARELRDP